MKRIVHELPAVVTCYAYRQEYIEEMEGMLVTIKEHHPDWPIVIGRGPVAGFDRPTFEVESDGEKFNWTLPVSLYLDGSEQDFLRICFIKAWWIAQVWHRLGDLVGADRNRLVWTDADARFNGPLDIELDPNDEAIAGPWWSDPEDPDHEHICGGLLLFQGVKQGIIENIVDEWATRCLSHIEQPRPQTKPWPDDDQDLLTEVLKNSTKSNSDYTLVRLEMEKYIGLPTDGGKELVGRHLIDHWYMSAKMRMPEYQDRNWPPPEEYRRHAEIGTPIPNINWKRPDDEPSR